MTYYLAVLLDSEGVWLETCGSTDKSDVDWEVRDWKDKAERGDKVHRKTFAKEATQAEIEAWVRTL